MTRLTVALIIALGFSLRAYFALLPPPLDAANFAVSASIFAHGLNIYTSQPFYNYSPLLGIPLALVTQLPLPFAVAWRLFLSCVSLVNGLLITRLSKRPQLVFTAYWLCPATILYDGYSGQFESLAVLPLLIALAYQRWTFPGGASGLIVKHVTLPLTWALFVYRTTPKRAALWLVAALALFALTFTPYLPAGLDDIVRRVLLYHSWGGYGFGSPVLFYAAIAVAPFAARRLGLDLIDGLVLCAVVQVVTTYGMGSNNIYPLMALGFIRPSRWLVPLCAVYVLLVNPWHPLEMAQPINTNNALWLVCLAWLAVMVSSRVRLPSAKDFGVQLAKPIRRTI